MLLHIIRKELLDHLLSLRFAIACGLYLVVFMLTSLVLVRDYREALSTYNMNTVMHRSEVMQRTEVNSLWQGVMADRPLNAMNILVRGVAADLTESVRVQPRGGLDFPEAFEQNPVVPLFPAVDFVFIVGVIASLLALAFSYDAVSGERESGVLKLLMSYSLPRDTVLLGKWIGGYLALIAPFVLAFLVGLVAIALYPDVELGGDDMLGVLGLVLLALLYLGAIYSLGIFVSARTELVSTSITVLLLIWVGLILAFPNMAPYAVGQLLPVPSRGSIDRQKAEIRRDGQRQAAELARQERERTGAQNPWSDAAFRTRMETFWQEIEAETQKVEDSYAARIQQQARWAGIAARLSPLTSFNLAAFDLAATGIEQERRFVEALKVYSQTWTAYTEKKSADYQKFIQERMAADGVASFSQEDIARFNVLDLSDHPRFDFTHMGIGDRLVSVWPDVLLLGVWNILFFMLAYLSFLRSDIR